MIPRAGERRQYPVVLVQGVVDVVVLVDGEVRADARDVGPGDDPSADQVDHGLVGLVGRLSHSTDKDRRGTGSPLRHALTSAFGGSASSIEANRQESVTPWSRRRMAAVLGTRPPRADRADERTWAVSLSPACPRSTAAHR